MSGSDTMIEINNKTKQAVNVGLAIRAGEKFLRHYGLAGRNVSVAFVGDAVIRRLNRIYRGSDRVTDVLAFGAGDGENFLGEIIINYAQIRRQAKKYRHSVKKELMFILVHGFLHLAGYDDGTEKDRLLMIKLGEEFIRREKL